MLKKSKPISGKIVCFGYFLVFDVMTNNAFLG